jgi:hypothetical protein
MRQTIFTFFLVIISLQALCQESKRPLDEFYITMSGGYHTGVGEYTSNDEVKHINFNDGALFSVELTGKLDNVYCGLDMQYWRHSQSISVSKSRMVQSFGISLQLYFKHNFRSVDFYGGGGPGVSNIKLEDAEHIGREDSFLYFTLKARCGADINFSKVLALNIDASVMGLSLLIDNKLVFSVKAGPKIRIF